MPIDGCCRKNCWKAFLIIFPFFFTIIKVSFPPWTEPFPEWANRLRDLNTARPANPRRSSVFEYRPEIFILSGLEVERL
jgi:hypothetical protein